MQQFFRYLEDAEEITRHPMQRIRQPTTPKKLVPVVVDEELATLLACCAGKSFLDRRDTALIRLLLDTGARLSEIASLDLDDVNLRRDLVKVHGKGDKEQAIPFGEKTGQALTRYLRVRAKHKGANLSALFLAERGRRRLASDGVKTMLRRRGEQAGIGRLHAYRFRHTLAHEWQLNDGNQTDLMAIMGWESPEMLRLYGNSAAAIRAQNSHRKLVVLRLGDPAVPIPPPFDQVLIDHLASRPNCTTATNPASRWLFPGRRADQPIHPGSLRLRMHTLSGRRPRTSLRPPAPAGSATPSAGQAR